MRLDELLADLEAFGQENDRRQTQRPRQMLNIPRTTGQFLQVLVTVARAQRILEIGTSNGYSTLWLARAARAVGGRVTTVERSEFKIALARVNFEHSGMSDVITLVHGQAGEFLAHAADASFDFVFLDSERSEYPRWWQDLNRILAPGGLCVADNALSHRDELKPFFALVEANPRFTTCVMPVGKGEYMAVKSLEPLGKGESAAG
jgi:predicted O-methyltransferase YrrM